VVEDFEVNTIEASCTIFGCDPDVAIVGLEDLVNAILREAVFGGPRLVT
jgi:hypothetical protein